MVEMENTLEDILLDIPNRIIAINFLAEYYYLKETELLRCLTDSFWNDQLVNLWDKEKNERCRRLSLKERVANLADNLEELGELLGAETLQSILLDRIFSIKEEGSFYPHEQWMIGYVEKMKDEITTITELWNELLFESKRKLAEIIAQYKEVFHSKAKTLHFCNIISSIKEMTIATKNLYDENRVEELCYISGFGRADSRGNFPELTWKEICDWAKANLSTDDWANFEPNLEFASVDFEPAYSSDITELKDNVGKKERTSIFYGVPQRWNTHFARLEKAQCLAFVSCYQVGYGNLRNYLWNKKVIAERVCSAILKDCIEAADPILRLEDAAFNIVSKHFPNKSPEELKNLVKQSSILNFFDFDKGLVAIFQRYDQGVFLKMIFDIDKREFAKWVALKIQLDPHHLLMRLQEKERVCAKHVNPKTANCYQFPSMQVKLFHCGVMGCPEELLSTIFQEWREGERVIEEIVISFQKPVYHPKRLAEAILGPGNFSQLWSVENHETSIYTTHLEQLKEQIALSDLDSIEIFIALSGDKTRSLIMTVASNAITIDTTGSDLPDIERLARRTFARFAKINSIYMVNTNRLRKLVAPMR